MKPIRGETALIEYDGERIFVDVIDVHNAQLRDRISSIPDAFSFVEITTLVYVECISNGNRMVLTEEEFNKAKRYDYNYAPR